ncbi:GAF domain-containing protein [uncultured Bilophila sp.]|nr:GAF domain-containing protein [uncultured Bilophila sp.]
MTGHDYFHALLEVATVINSSLEPSDVLHKITEQTAKAMNCKASTIRLLDRSGKLLLASAAWGLSAGYMRKGPVEVAKSGLDGEVLAGKIIHLRDACSDGRFQYPESARAEGLVSVLSAPLMVNGKAIGILRVYSSVERDFTPDECDFMGGVANIAAIAIENARMHEATKLNYELLTSYNYQVFED